MRGILDKKAAIEMSMTTVVVIVLSMVMLALGLTLVRTLFSGAILTAGSLNTQVQSEINKIFQNEEQKVAIISEQGQLAPSRGKDQSVFWLIVADTSGKYDYEFIISPSECADATKGYHLTKEIIGKWFIDLKGSKTLAANDKQSYRLPMNIPSNAPSCLFKLDLEVKKDNVIYGGTQTVYIRPKAATLFG